jgi:hypothetical protein
MLECGQFFVTPVLPRHSHSQWPTRSTASLLSLWNYQERIPVWWLEQWLHLQRADDVHPYLGAAGLAAETHIQ